MTGTALSATLSPREAARIAGCGRTTITRALTSRALPAIRGNDGAWSIRRDDLDRWTADRATPVQDTARSMTETAPGPGLDLETSNRLAAAEATVRQMAERIADLKAERDRQAADFQAERDWMLIQAERDRAALEREQETVDDLRKRLDRAEERVLALSAPSVQPAPQAAQEWPSERLEAAEPPKATRGFLARLLGR